MTKVKTAEKTTEIIKTGMPTWTDEETLELFLLFLDKVNIHTEFIENDQDLVVGTVMTLACGDKFISSDPLYLDWPMQQLPIPDAFKEKLN